MTTTRNETRREHTTTRRSAGRTTTAGRRLVPGLRLAALALAACAGLVGDAAARDPVFPGDDVALTSEAREMPVLHKKRNTDGSHVEAKLAPHVRAALNAWAPTATALGLTVALPEEAPALVLGRADEELLTDAAQVFDDTWALLAPLHETREDAPSVVVAVLLDEQALHSDVWEALVEDLKERKVLSSSAAANLRTRRGGVTARASGVFVQPTYDMAGDASAGDDEFRLGNEVAHKGAVCWLRLHFGEVPDTLRWGFGYVAEQRLFRSIYQFDASGFVAAADHFDWPKLTEQALDDFRKEDRLTLTGAVVQQGHAGGANTPQRVTWGALDYLLHEEPEQLATLFGELGDLHRTAEGYRRVTDYIGDGAATEEKVEAVFGAVDIRKLQKHVKRVK